MDIVDSVNEVRCDLCGSQKSFVNLVLVDSNIITIYREIGFDKLLSTKLCLNCGWLFKYPKISEQQLRIMYEKFIHTSCANDEAYKNDVERGRKIWNWIGSFVRDTKKLKILDIGGGEGAVANGVSKFGHDVHVLDYSQKSANKTSGYIKFHQGSIETFVTKERFDLIMLNHVLEHSFSPRLLLGKSRELLSEYGMVYIEVPFELYTPVLLGKTGDPAHVGYFTIQTLKKYLSVSGFKLLSIDRVESTYGLRKVMILRALAAKNKQMIDKEIVIKGNRLVIISRIVCEMFNVKQLFLVLRQIVRTRK